MKAYLSVQTGVGKSECEDTALFNGTVVNGQAACLEADTFRCIAVADGVGGQPGGRTASRFISSEISRIDLTHLSANGLRNFAQHLNARLIRNAAGNRDTAQMATTLTCVVATNNGYYLIHAGNTRVYAMQGAYLKQLTEDQTTYQWLRNCGQYEAAERCNKSEILCCLGGGNVQYAGCLVVEKLFDECPDTLLLTSDGIHEYVDLDAMEDALATSGSDLEAAQRIHAQALQNGSGDDRTVVILRR